jgi:imidazolonepropionase-like amidohydrolase
VAHLPSLPALVLLAVAAPAAAGPGPADPADPTAAVTALVHLRLIDGTGAAPVPGAVVIVRGDRIVAAGPAGVVQVPADARILDLGGATLLPGLVNAHVHAAYDAAQLQAWARAGVTTVRDEGPFDPVGYLRTRRELARDVRNATIVAATPILTVPGGYGWAYAETPAGMRALVQAHLDLGADVVKTSIEAELGGRSYELPSPAILQAVVETAHASHRKVSVHVTRPWSLAQAVELGADDVAHGVMNRVEDPLMARMVARNVAWVPTLELWRCAASRFNATFDRIAAENVGRFHRAGGVVALGTDFAGYPCAWDRGLPITELLALQDAGLSPLDVLVAATRNAARVVDREAELGTVTPGKRADLLAVRGDPLADLHALEAPVLVMHQGQVIRDERPAGGP